MIDAVEEQVNGRQDEFELSERRHRELVAAVLVLGEVIKREDIEVPQIVQTWLEMSNALSRRSSSSGSRG
jgi:hypothetical protein